VAEPPVTFAGLLRKLRTEARLTQEELAEAAALSPRSVSDLERGIAATPRRETVRLLADALNLAGQARAEFEAVARGRPVPAGPDTDATALRTLPRDIASFTGRQRELAELVEAAADAGGVVGIHAIGGMAGVGKTAFAVHAAHRLADRFPGGQIFLPLHGHTPGQQPVDPADALASLLLTAGVPPAQIPPGLEARIALWRDRLAEKQLLLVLDDAASSEQVRPLLPGAGGSLVLVTSRRHLSALEDATAVSLDTLPPGEAAGLLVRLASRSGLSPDDPAAAEITALCGYLPLAIGMVARQLHHHPAWTTAGRAAELAAARDRLELMTTENLSVAAAFNLSYADLTPGQQRLFRRLGLHPGTDIDAYAAAALDGTDLAAARRGLEALYDQYLLTESAQGRYRLHDLIREHARALADHLDPDRDRDGATTRLLDYYQHAAARANTLIARQPHTSPAPAEADAVVPAVIPDLADSEQALAWARTERASLLACLDYATRTGQHARVIALTAGLAGLLRSDGPWADAITRHTAAIQAAGHLGDRLGQAHALTGLGDMRRLTGDYPAAVQALEQALGIYRDLGDRLGQARALHGLGDVRRPTGDYPAAVQALEQALGIYRDLGDRLGQANALNGLGVIRLTTGDYPTAARVLEQALGIYRDLGDQHGQANVLNNLGNVRQVTGDFPAAAQALEQALGIYRDLGTRLGQANALLSLGEVWRLIGDYPAAAQVLEQALDIYRDLGTRLGQAAALGSLGEVRRATGDYPAAAQALDQALGIFRDLGIRSDEATALNERGTLYRLSGDVTQAEECHQQALDLARAIASPWNEAYALAGLGRCALAAGHATQAEELLRQALEIFQRIGAAEVPDLLAELAALTGHEQPGSALGWVGGGSGEPGGCEDSGGRDRGGLVGASRGRFAAAGRPARRCRAGALERLPARGGSRPLPGWLWAGQDGDRGLHRPAGGRGELRPGLPPVRPVARQTGPAGR
jgi:tetratricopeptide (TPR) repeat protein/transcriptional regulator with XRE-family HTH domain